jgi:hypothetical protein
MKRNLKDATWVEQIIVSRSDVKRAVPGDPTCCALMQGLKSSNPNVEKGWYFRNVAWIKYYGDDTLWRFMGGKFARIMAGHFDYGAPLPSRGLIVTLEPPKGVRSLNNIRSDRFKALRKASKERQKGKAARTYRKVDPLSLRPMAPSLTAGAEYDVL